MFRLCYGFNKIYHEKFPSNKIHIICYSYGTLIVHNLEHMLINKYNISIIYIAGAFKGTKMMNFLEYIKLATFHTNVIKNLKYNANTKVTFNNCIGNHFIYSDMD